MQITQAHSNAADAIIELIAYTIGKNRQIHPATAISACARLAGSFMFRSFNFQPANASPGSAVLSEQANEKGPALINVLGGALHNFGISPDTEKMNNASTAQPDLSFLDTLQLLQDKARDIMQQNNLDTEQMAYACAMATAFIIKECRNDLPVETGFTTAVYGFIEGSKTWPPDYGTTPPKKKSLFKFWK